MTTWKVRPYWLVLIASSSIESVPPVSARKPSMSTSGLPSRSGGFWLPLAALLLPLTRSLYVESTYAALQICPAASHAACVSMDASEQTRTSLVVMLYLRREGMHHCEGGA